MPESGVTTQTTGQAPELPAPLRERLRGVRGFVFDMDGTMVLGDRRNHGLRPLPGAVEMTRWLAARDVPYVLFTNGTTRTPREYAALLRDVGFALPDTAMMTPAVAAADMFARRGHYRVMVLGNEGLTRPLREAGFEVVCPTEVSPKGGAPACDAVLVGWYPEFTMPQLEVACAVVWGGALLFSCSQSVFFATADGRALGTSRAITAMISSVTGCRIRVVGKPSRDALRSAAHRLGCRLKDLAVVGDDPDLEVPMAHAGRATAIAVGTGLGGADSFDHLPEGRRPHLSLRGVDQLLALYREVGLSEGARPARADTPGRV